MPDLCLADFNQVRVDKTKHGRWSIDFTSLGDLGFQKLLPVIERYTDVVYIDHAHKTVVCKKAGSGEERFWHLMNELMHVYLSLRPAPEKRGFWTRALRGFLQ